LVAAALAVIAAGAGAQAPPAASGPTVSTGSIGALEARVAHRPQPVLGTDGRWHLVYEVYLLNTAPIEQRITRIEVRNARNGRVLLRYGTPRRIRAVTTTSTTAGGGVDRLAPNVGGVVFVDLAFAGRRAIPTRLVHRIVTRLGAMTLTLDGAPTRVNRRPAARIGPPLVGDGYLNENGCCGRSDHTRALLTIDGTRWLAQRFAIDWVRLDAERRPYVGDWRVNENWHIFGDPIISVSGGRVLETLDTMPENTPPTPATDLTPYTALGNHVIVAMGNGRFSLYAHMQPGSVAVEAGQRVRRGQLLGRVGNTGSSAAPHLHFHVTDGPPAVSSNGAPWVFDRFGYIARARNADAVNADVPAPVAVLENAPPPRERARQMPLKADVVDFPGSREAVLAGAAPR
jgi:hypothetical protein